MVQGHGHAGCIACWRLKTRLHGRVCAQQCGPWRKPWHTRRRCARARLVCRSGVCLLGWFVNLGGLCGWLFVCSVVGLVAFSSRSTGSSQPPCFLLWQEFYFHLWGDGSSNRKWLGTMPTFTSFFRTYFNHKIAGTLRIWQSVLVALGKLGWERRAQLVDKGAMMQWSMRRSLHTGSQSHCALGRWTQHEIHPHSMPTKLWQYTCIHGSILVYILHMWCWK